MPFRIYTKTGDRGETALFGGRRVLKSHLRVDAYGTVDELNSFIGLLHDTLADQDPSSGALLLEIQHRLFSLGAALASDPENNPPKADLEATDIQALEDRIDAMDAHLSPLQNFILPSGHPTVSLCHICRTVCRRAERLVVALDEQERVDELILPYLNRLSDFFFILARYIAHTQGADEIIWLARKRPE